jgi:hypothetical protein
MYQLNATGRAERLRSYGQEQTSPKNTGLYSNGDRNIDFSSAVSCGVEEHS